jgi:hypothetical protein
MVRLGPGRVMMRKEGAPGAGGAEFALDGAECINLQQILQAFNSTISEEHAWALFHQSARCFHKCLAEGTTCYLATEPRHLLLHRDGSVHPKSLLHPGGQSYFNFGSNYYIYGSNLLVLS